MFTAILLTVELPTVIKYRVGFTPSTVFSRDNKKIIRINIKKNLPEFVWIKIRGKLFFL